MTISQGLLGEFDHEMANTRKTLERVPDDKFDWKPHAKSRTMGALAAHIALLPQWVAVTVNSDTFDVSSAEGRRPPQPALKTRAEVLAAFDKNVPEARAAIAGASDEVLLAPWSLLNGGKPVFTLPRAAVVRAMFLNHEIHHRAQLGVYLRLNDIPLPATYGPSADEGAL